MSEATEPCAICGGTKEEHKDRQHAYTNKPGELLTPQQQKKQYADPAPQGQRIVLGAPTQHVPNLLDSPALNRLVNVLVDKDVLSLEEALHIALGRPLS